MKNTIYLLLLLLIWNPALSWGYLEIPQGMYEDNSASVPESSSDPVRVDDTPSEVTRSEQPVLQTASAAPANPAREEPKAPAQNKGGSFFNPSYSMPSRGTNANKGEKLVSLKSCDPIKMILGKKPKSGKVGKCGDVTIAESFAPVLMKNLPICIAEGAKASGIDKPIQSTNVYNADSYSKRKTSSGSRWSLHSTGRAFDIWQIDVMFSDGTTLKTPMTVSSKNKPFYKKFNACWERLIKQKMAKINSQCQRFDGLINCTDKNHQDHVHLSLPYCPRASGYSTI
jgi:Extensin-like protein C-terminus